MAFDLPIMHLISKILKIVCGVYSVCHWKVTLRRSQNVYRKTVHSTGQSHSITSKEPLERLNGYFAFDFVDPYSITAGIINNIERALDFPISCQMKPTLCTPAFPCDSQFQRVCCTPKPIHFIYKSLSISIRNNCSFIERRHLYLFVFTVTIL